MTNNQENIVTTADQARVIFAIPKPLLERFEQSSVRRESASLSEALRGAIRMVLDIEGKSKQQIPHSNAVIHPIPRHKKNEEF
jgi:metal-responsive CopG/Arc/MetJ family transcriptional regulator